MIKRVIITSPGCGGKDFLKSALEKKGFKCSVSYTTRPPRTGEIDGVNYHYITEDKFLQMVGNDEFREWNKFADKWYYGTSKVLFYSANLFIMTPSGIRALNTAERSESLIVYLDIAEDVRRQRLSARMDADDPERRLGTDRVDFAGFEDFDLLITDHEFNTDELYETITSKIRWSKIMPDTDKIGSTIMTKPNA